MEQHDLAVRPLRGRDELDLFNHYPYLLNDELADDLDAGRRRPEWMWMALRGERPVARVAWWGGPDPQLLDIFDADTVDDGVRLLRTALRRVLPTGATPPEYLRYLPPDWREQPDSRLVVERLLDALGQLGAVPLVERLRFDWRPGTPIAARSGRLRFRPVRDRAEMVALMKSTLDGTLDAHSRDDLTRMTPPEAAAAHYDRELAEYRSPRDWWRIATLPDGEPVGFVCPARNNYNPIIGYIGVLPAHRGNGYIDDLLAEGTRVLAAEGVPHIGAATDVGNVPMAAAFARAGYATIGRVVNWHWPSSRP